MSVQRMTSPYDSRSTAFEVLEGVDLTGRHYVVTGGASGIGAESARALARAGGQVLIGTRDPTSAQALIDEVAAAPGRGSVQAAALDLTSPSSVAAFTRSVDGAVDALVANAGVMAIPTRQLTSVGWETQLATNYLGHFALALGLRDRLRAAEAGRVVVVSSSAHLRSPFDFDDPQFERRPYDRWTAYSQSKTADVLLATGIAERWGGDGIVANALMPGWITTRLQRHLDDETLRSMGAMDEEGNRIEQSFYKTPQQGASTTVLLAASPLVDGVTGRYFEDNQEAATVPDGAGRTNGVAAYAVDRSAAGRLWDLGSSALA
ncbi:SDR family NAD(P)-dependent oxidoreductase [Agromyces aureus]|uniref:Probable oxidoreductase n=1 Tax=Agromyces aureus TaxID=453304 RepID=A0A191WG00_9MICO|nr:oxidoreductase [Agromyces aureus]